MFDLKGHGTRSPQCVELLMTFSSDVMHAEVRVFVFPHSVTHILFGETTGLVQARGRPE